MVRSFKRIEVNANQLIIDNSRHVAFEATIKEACEFSKSILVCLLFEEFKSIYNIFAIDYEGNKLWRVENIYKRLDDFPYVGIDKDADGNARLVNFDGFVLTVDPDTGKLLKKEFLK